MSIIKGTLYIVATPIGNLDDLSPRAIAVLESVDLILAEDTRHSKPLLKHFGISTKVKAYHDHNEREQTPVLIQQLLSGESMALISDAGTPLICDPGYHLVSQAHKEGLKVVPVPGASALVSALSSSGFSTEKFIFEGYLPVKSTARQQRMSLLSQEERTLAFYEAPHRIVKSLEDAIVCFGGERQAVIAKELTKLHENIQRGSLDSLLRWLKSDKGLEKGEFVVVIQGAKKVSVDDQESRRILKILLNEGSFKDAVRLTCEITGRKKNEIYKLAMVLKDEQKQ